MRLHPATHAITDTGYLGLQKRHGRTTMPKTRSKTNPLNTDDKWHPRAISRDRILAENVIGSVKRFEIVSEQIYRNHRKRFGQRVTLIAAAYNEDLPP